MINKQYLLSSINKYSLGGLIESVKWEIKDKYLTVKFNSPSKEMIGIVKCKNIPLEDSIIAISNTTQLVKLIGIADNQLILSYTKQGKLITKLIISDNQFNSNYALADLIIIPKAGELTEKIEFEIKATLDETDINSIIKAKGALSESENVVIKPHYGFDNELQIEMEFGGGIEHANKVSFFIKNVEQLIEEQFDFSNDYNSEIIKDILYYNKDMVSGTIQISLQGIMKIEFENENSISTYYLVSKNS